MRFNFLFEDLRSDNMRFFKCTLVLILLLFVFTVVINAADKISVWLTESEFTAQTGIAVEYNNLSWGDFENRFLMAAASGDAPDVCGSGSLFLPDLGVRGAMIDLTKMPNFKEVYARTYPGFYLSLQYKGLTFGIPYTASVSTLYQRDDILRNLGIQSLSSWDELKQVLPKLQANNTNFSLHWFLTETLYADVYMFMWQRGADDYNADLTKSGYDTPECIAAFKEYTDLYTKYKIPKEIPVFQAFVNGDLAMVIQYPEFYQNLTYSAPQIAGKWSMTQVLGTKVGGQVNRISGAGGCALGIFTSSKKKNQSWEFIKWITAEKTQLAIANKIMTQIKGALFLPSNNGSVNKIPLPKEALETFSVALSTGTGFRYGLVAPKHRRRYLQMAAQKVILQGVDPEKAIREAAAEHNVEIKRKLVEYDRYIKKLLDEQKK